MLSAAAVTGRADCQQENCVQMSPYRGGFSLRPQSTTNRTGRGRHPGACRRCKSHRMADTLRAKWPDRPVIWNSLE